MTKHRRKRRHKKAKTPLLAFFAIILLAVCALANGKKYKYTGSTPAFAQLYELASATIEHKEKMSAPSVDTAALSDLGTLRSRYYSVDKKTAMTSDNFDINKLMATDVRLSDKGSRKKPKILIFHTHAHEMYADSGEGGGVLGAGELLKTTLEDEYGIACLHVAEHFDTVNGRLQILGAYERMEPRIREILAQYPSIEMVIDLHRDGVNEHVRLVSSADGEDCAKIMFFNGLCQKIGSDGTLHPIDGLENPYIQTNLALSLKAQMKAEELYPGLTRKIYLNAYRYSLHFKPDSMLIELGAQTNTEAEVHNSVKKLAKIIAETVKP